MKKWSLFLVLGSLLAFSKASYAQPHTTRLNHVALYVYDLKKAADFYEHIVNLDSIPEPFHDGKHVWLHIGPQAALHLIQGAASVTTHDKNSHLCFSVPSVDAFIERLNKAHIPYEDWPGKPMSVTKRVDGVKQIYFTDPDGYWVEINDAKE
jgi:lactoylglutathione lyase